MANAKTILSNLAEALEYRLPSFLYTDGTGVNGLLMSSGDTTQTGAIGDFSATPTATQLSTQITALKGLNVGTGATDLTLTNQKALQEYISAAESLLSRTAGSIGASEIAAGAVGTSELAANAVTSAKIADGEIVNADISGTAAIVYSKLSFSNNIVAGDLAADSVEASEIAAGAVGTSELATDSVIAAKIAAGAVTPAKLSDAYGPGNDQDLDDYIGDVRLAPLSISQAIGAGVLSHAARTDPQASSSVSTIQSALLSALNAGNKYAASDDLAKAIINAIGDVGDGTSSFTVENLASDIDLMTAEGTGAEALLATEQAKFLTAVGSAAATVGAIGDAITATIAANDGTGDSPTVVNADVDTVLTRAAAGTRATITSVIGDVKVGPGSITEAIGGRTLSLDFAPDDGVQKSIQEIHQDLQTALDATNTYSSATELATAIVNVIGQTSGTFTVANLASDIGDMVTEQSSNVATEQALLLEAVRAATGDGVTLAGNIGDAFTTTIDAQNGTGGNNNNAVSNANLDTAISNGISSDHTSITSAIGPYSIANVATTLTGAIGNTALATTAQTISGAIDELHTEIDTLSSDVGGISSSAAYVLCNGNTATGDLVYALGALTVTSNAVTDTDLLAHYTKCASWANAAGNHYIGTGTGQGDCANAAFVDIYGDAIAQCMGRILTPQ
ncbi:MAG: hypothetical protein RLN62_06560 [Rickettsiales bacterium]